jgi:hypothetical protein
MSVGWKQWSTRLYESLRLFNGYRAPTKPIIIQAVDRSIIETVEAFVRFQPGFHGDTGMRDYLYHRLMTNLPHGGTYIRMDGGGTLLVQPEWYTECLFLKTGEKPSPGRFDLGIPDPEDLFLSEPRLLVAFECGRNKKPIDLFDWAKEREGCEPADITKLAREIKYEDLPYGYALEFYDKDQGQADELIRRLPDELIRRLSPSGAEYDHLRVVVLVCIGDTKPKLTFLPAAWEKDIRLRFRAELERIEGLKCCAGAPQAEGAARNRVTKEVFLADCSAEGRDLIEAVEERFGGRVKLVFGGNTMTVNRRPTGLLLRMAKTTPNSISELDQVVSRELAARLPLSIGPIYKIDGTPDFRNAVITAVSKALEENAKYDAYPRRAEQRGQGDAAEIP